MFSIIWEKLNKIKIWVVERVRWAEVNLKGKTGAEKRAAVVERIDELIPLPFWLEWADGFFIGMIVDKVCNLLNILTDEDGEKGDWSALNASNEEIAALTDVPPTVLEKSVKEHTEKGKTVDERFAEICAEYGLATAEGNLTQNFSRSEFACKCGCGFADIDPRLADICQSIRDYMGEPVRVNSGCRCESHNAKVGGVKGSWHTKGKAADLSCASGADKLYEAVKRLYDKGELKGLEYCIKYPSFIHIDIGTPRKQRFAVKS